MSRLLSLQGVSVGYQRPVLGPLDLSLDRGEVVGVWGPNGSGKSTLLKALIGAARVFQGRQWIQPGLRISIQQQHPVRLPEMPLSGREFLALTGATRQPPPSALRLALDGRIDRLSGGQFQLLALWACLAAEADLVLLDEPNNNLDPQTSTVLAQLLRDLPAHRAVLLVSHERDFMAQACTRVLEVGGWN